MSLVCFLGKKRRTILAEITHVFVTSLAHLPAHRRQDIFRLLMGSGGQDECLWFAPVQLFDSVLHSPLNKKNEETLKVKFDLIKNIQFLFLLLEISNRCD